MRIYETVGGRMLVPVGQSRTTDDLGDYRLFGLSRGSYYVSVTAHGDAAGPPSGSGRSGIAPTYHPGSPDLASATPIAVRVGETVPGIDIAGGTDAATVQLRGRVTASDGMPLAGSLTLLHSGLALVTHRAGMSPDGTFTITGLTPGAYVVNVHGAGRHGPESLAAPITVTDDAESRIALATVRNGTIRGRVMVDPAMAERIDLARLRVGALSPASELRPFGRSSPAGAVRPDGTFELSVEPGPAVLRIEAGDWMLARVFVDGSDVTDSGVTVSPQERVDGIEVYLSETPPAVSGSVVDGRGSPVADATVVVFARDEELWGFTSRHVVVLQTDSQGGFTLPPLPAADYHAVAIDDGSAVDATSLAFLRAVRAAAMELSLGTRQPAALRLTLTAAP
jgi:hypothetical protein